MGMNHGQRKLVIFDFLYSATGGVLRRYRAPEHLSDDAMRDEVNLLVEDINQSIPDGLHESELRALLPVVNTMIRRRYGAQVWPPAKIFIGATEDAVRAAAHQKAAAQPTASAALDPFNITAKRMCAGETVGEGYLWGRQAVEALGRGGIDPALMAAYRSGAFLARRQQYGEDAAMRWEAEAKARHHAAQEETLARDTEIASVNMEAAAQAQAHFAAAESAMARRTQQMRGQG